MKTSDVALNTIRELVFGEPDAVHASAGCFIVWRETTPEEREDLICDLPFGNEVYAWKGGEGYAPPSDWNAALESNDKRLFIHLGQGQNFMTLGISTNDDSGLMRYRFGIEITPVLLKELVKLAREAGWYNKPHTTDDERQQAMLAHSPYNPAKPD